MGVVQLWSLLDEARGKCSLESLSGKTLAVDLSGWICEASALKATSGVVTKPYLRTLYFRVAQLYHLNIRLVFVCDGNAISLKQDTIARRINERRGLTSAKSRQGTTTSKKKSCNRSNLRRHINECCQLLKALGIPTVLANGEAEALCALLNYAGAVDGCITDDNDAFLYGARTVYRDFSVNAKGTSELSEYSATTIQSTTGLNRHQLVALALLLGCDYLPQGVHGVGSATAMKFLQAAHGDVLTTLLRWASSDPGDPPVNPEELKVYRKICQSQGQLSFQEVIDEYLQPNEQLPSKQLEWCRPNISEAIAFLTKQLEWPVVYAKEKLFPLLTHWDLCHGCVDPTALHPLMIVKKRVRQGVDCFEITWRGTEAEKPDAGCAEDGKVSKDSKPWMTTIEDAESVRHAFPHLVETFEESLKAKTSKKSRHKVDQAVNNKPSECPMSSAQAPAQNEGYAVSLSDKENNHQPVTRLSKVSKPKHPAKPPLAVSNPFRITSAERDVVSRQRRPLLSGDVTWRESRPFGKPAEPVTRLFPLLTLELDSDGDDDLSIVPEKCLTVEKSSDAADAGKRTDDHEGLLPLVERLKLKRERQKVAAMLAAGQDSQPLCTAAVSAVVQGSQPPCMDATSSACVEQLLLDKPSCYNHSDGANCLSDYLADLSLVDYHDDGVMLSSDAYDVDRKEQLSSPVNTVSVLLNSETCNENKIVHECLASENLKAVEQSSASNENKEVTRVCEEDTVDIQADRTEREDDENFGDDTALLASLADCSLEEMTPKRVATGVQPRFSCDQACTSALCQADLDEVQLLLSLGDDTALWSPVPASTLPHNPVLSGTASKPITIN